MKTGIRIGTMGLLAAGLLVGQMAFAQGQGRRQGKGAGTQMGNAGASEVSGEGAKERRQKRQEARAQHKQQMRERMKKQREARKALMEAVAAEEDAQKALALVREHCVSQHTERSTFHARQTEQRLETIGERLRDRNMDEARREEILKRMVKNMEERKAKAEAQHAELLANLDALKGKEDLTKKDILGALRNSRSDMKRDRSGKRNKARTGEMMRQRNKQSNQAPDA